MFGLRFKVSCHFFKTKRRAAAVDSDGDQVRDFAARIPHKHSHTHTPIHNDNQQQQQEQQLLSNCSSTHLIPPATRLPTTLRILSLSLCRALSLSLSLSFSLKSWCYACARSPSFTLVRLYVCVCVYWCCINKSNQRTFLSNPTQNETERRTWLCYCVIIFRVYEAGKGGREWEQRLDYFRVNSVWVWGGRKEVG